MDGPKRDTRDGLEDLYARPGFSIRRAHQLATAFFEEAVGALGVTTTQFGVLYAIQQRPGVDQIGLGQLLAVDRSTIAMVVRHLEHNHCLERQVSSTDRRRKTLQLTDHGKTILNTVLERTRESRHQVLAPLTPDEAAIFMLLVRKIVRGFDAPLAER